MIKLRVLRWECYPGLLTWAQYHHKGSYKRKATVRGGVTIRQDVGVRPTQPRLQAASGR